MSISAPYCTSGDVYLMRLYVEDPQGSDYKRAGVPRKSVVEHWISQVASQMDQAYAAAGYEIPLTALSGETWPTYQTTFLKYFNAVGVASLTGGSTATPPVIQFIGSRRVSRSFYEYEWMRLIEGARALMRGERTDVLIRAATLVGSPVDYLLSDPAPPLMDFLEGYEDPTLYDTLRDFTNRWQLYMTEQNRYNRPDTDNAGSIEYLYLLHDRLGYTYDA